jgi:hypothetical protein
MNELYEIVVGGDVDAHWSQWFGGLAVTHATQGETVLRGTLRDQAELYGLLNKCRDLGLTLISVKKADRAGVEK